MLNVHINLTPIKLPKKDFMKKLIVLVSVLGVVVFCYLKTNRFTYLNGQLSDDFTHVLTGLSALAIIISFVYAISGWIKKKVDEMQVTPFRFEED